LIIRDFQFVIGIIGVLFFQKHWLERSGISIGAIPNGFGVKEFVFFPVLRPAMVQNQEL